MATPDLNTEWWKTESTSAPADGSGLMPAPVVTPTTYAPAATTVNKPTDTVAGQVDSIVAADGPLMQRAAVRADQQMNRRGLMNSSMAVGAGQAAVMDAALPIAQQDASTYSTVNRENTAATNTAGQFNAGATNTASAQTAQLASQTNLARADMDQRASQFNASQSNDLLKLGMDANNKRAVSDIEASYKILMQGNQSASEIYKQATKNINDVMANKDMGQAAKDTAVANQVSMLRKGLEITGAMANLNLVQYLDFTGVPT